MNEAPTSQHLESSSARVQEIAQRLEYERAERLVRLGLIKFSGGLISIITASALLKEHPNSASLAFLGIGGLLLSVNGAVNMVGESAREFFTLNPVKAESRQRARLMEKAKRIAERS